MYASLLQLASRPQGPAAGEAQLAAALLPLLHSVFVASQRLPAAEVSVEEVAFLLAVEACNGFCVTAAAAAGEEVRVRGTALYLRASRMNHCCFPNVARFDYFDGPGAGRTRLLCRTIDPVPAGAELLMSYFPVTLPRAQRQQRLLGDYGFACACARCELEGVAAAGAGGGMAADEEGEAWEGQGEGYSAEYALWFLKNVCPLEGCGGTLAPPTTTADAMECNRCGCLRSDAQFYAELEA